jgi:hypothetical protein
MCLLHNKTLSYLQKTLHCTAKFTKYYIFFKYININFALKYFWLVGCSIFRLHMYFSELSHDNFKFCRHVNHIKCHNLERYHHTRLCQNSLIIYRIHSLRLWKNFWPTFLKSVCAISILSVCASHSINFWMPESIFMKLGMLIMATVPISTAYFINPSHQSVSVYVSFL